jgi:thioredoxin reductase (NADPH)
MAGPEEERFDLLIVGAGPAGLAAGIYAARSGLKTLITDKGAAGGQLLTIPVVENYPGFTRIAGQELAEKLVTHARSYAPIKEGEEVKAIRIGDPIEVTTDRDRYLTRALLFATGASPRKLGVPGEAAFFGRGVSYCAVCDGFFFRNKRAIVVGGGNSALTYALYLKNLGADVTIIHRRNEFRAEHHLKEAVAREMLPIVWNSVVEEIRGNEAVTAVAVKNLTEGTLQEIQTDGVFIAVGEKPNSELAAGIGVALTEGFISVDRNGRTNIPRVYAAGAVTGGVRQIVTEVSEGAVAALTAFADLAKPQR